MDQGFTHRIPAIAVAALASLWGPESPAQTEAGVQERIGGTYMHVGAGAFNPDFDSQLRNQSGPYALTVGGGRRQSRIFAWEIEVISSYQRFDTPASLSPPVFGSTSGRSTLDTNGLAGTAKFIYPHGSVEPYVGAGIGVYDTTLTVTGQQSGLQVSFERRSIDPGLHAVAGADFHLSARTSLVLEYRKIWLDADFGSGTGLTGTVKAGGNMLLAAYRRRF